MDRMNREDVLKETAEILLRGRKVAPLQTLKEEEAPTDLREVYTVQDAIARDFGHVGGWKIGAPSATEEPFFAPMPLAWIVKDGVSLSGERYRLRGVEAEIAFLVGIDLPAREQGYSREEVAAAMEACVPAIELLESAYVDPRAVPRLTMFADLQMHGGFVPGKPIENWQAIDWAAESIDLVIDGKVEMTRTGSNPGGTDLLRLLTYLANEGAVRTGGLKKGQWITTGSWTGATWLRAGQAAEARFTHGQPVTIHFA